MNIEYHHHRLKAAIFVTAGGAIAIACGSTNTQLLPERQNSFLGGTERFCPCGQRVEEAFPQATLCSPAVMKVKPFGLKTMSE